MNGNVDYVDYNEEKNKVPWGRILISFLILIVAVIIVLLLLKACGKTSLRDDLIEAGKDYYEKYPSKLPTEVGECLVVTLEQLENESLIKTDKYETCDDDATYVNACYLESKTYHYSAILSCEVEDTNYGMWQDGEEEDLNEYSDVRFKYLGEEKNSGTKYYYPNDLTNADEVKEYYASIPSTDYTGKEESEIGYKWYVEKEQNSYWNNGGYSSTQPSGYPTKGESKTVTTVSETKPSTASYRVITDTTIYRKQSVARPFIYYCYNDNENAVVVSDKPCSGANPNVANIEFTCDGTNKVNVSYEQLSTGQLPTCGDWSEWTTEKCSNSTTNGIKCESKAGYTYTDTMWKWYKNETVKSYYPSGSSSASEEKTYYVTSPVSGAIKDTTTEANVSKYYKLVKTEGESNFEEWLPVTDGYVNLTDLIEIFKNKNYNVESLKDINALEEIRYQYQLQYRNIEG